MWARKISRGKACPFLSEYSLRLAEANPFAVFPPARDEKTYKK
nr:MAG TPA: hypothetical protein [Caudoviricetes sp.]